MDYRQDIKLQKRIDWETVMKMPRTSGGHDDQMKGLLKNVTILGHWNEGDYTGMVATCVQLNDTKEVVIYNDYYGSCSGCDMWEGADDETVREQCISLANGAYIFQDVASCVRWLRKGDAERSYDWEDCRLNLGNDMFERALIVFGSPTNGGDPQGDV